jgi:hypothetical protein
MNTYPRHRPNDKRCRDAHPKRITVGTVVFERNDITANRQGVSERTLNRDDAKGAPYRFFGNIKYRPLPAYDDFVLASIKTNKPPPSKGRRIKR